MSVKREETKTVNTKAINTKTKAKTSARAELLFQKACAAEKKLKFPEALNFYIESLRQDKAYRPSLLSLGILYSRMQRREKSLYYLKLAYEIEVDAAICFNIGAEYYKAKNYKKSIQYLKESLKYDRYLLKSHLLLALLYQEIKKADKAILYFENVLKISPDYPGAILGYIVALNDLGKTRQAFSVLERYYDKLIQQETKRDIIDRLRAAFLVELGSLDESLAVYKKRHKEAPSFLEFQKCIDELRTNKENECQKMFRTLDYKIEEKEKKLSNFTKEKNSRLNSKLSKKETLSKQESVQENFDLSLLYLFKGDQEKALDLLWKARKIKASDEKEN